MGTGVFFLIAPVGVAGLIPWLLTGWQDHDGWWPLRLVGALLLGAGGAVLVVAFARFVTEGSGTPAPIAPTERLVVGGLYRYVRNPMYLAVVATIVGQALLLWRADLLAYAGAVLVLFLAFVRGYEEPSLQDRFGAPFEEYRREVPGWWPRLCPWDPGERDRGPPPRSDEAP